MTAFRIRIVLIAECEKSVPLSKAYVSTFSVLTAWNCQLNQDAFKASVNLSSINK